MQPNIKYSIIAVIAVIAIAMITVNGAFSQERSSTTTSIMAPHEGKKVLVMHITSGNPADSHQLHSATMGVEHSLQWHRNGFNVVIFLDVEGVLIGAKNVPRELQGVNEELKTFIAEGGRVIACSHCIAHNNLKPEDMLPSIEIDSHPFMIRLQDILRDESKDVVVLDY